MAMPAEDNTTENEFERLNQLGAEDPTLKENLINMFLEQTPELMSNIASHANAQEPVETKNAAHTFKGVCFNLGFDASGQLSKKIEEAALAQDFEQVNLLYAELTNALEELKSKLKAMLD